MLPAGPPGPQGSAAAMRTHVVSAANAAGMCDRTPYLSSRRENTWGLHNLTRVPIASYLRRHLRLEVQYTSKLLDV